MIEFVLLFSLGFLAAALLGLLVAPVIHRRIVTLTERRMRASVPLSTAEVRAEKDFARAAYAAENARLAVDLRGEMDRVSVQVTKVVRLEGFLAEKQETVLTLQQQLDAGNEEAGRLRSVITGLENKLITSQGALSSAQREISEKNTQIATLNDRINKLDGQLEEKKIDLATGETEIENFKMQIQTLRDERARLRDELRTRTTSAREAEIKLQRQENRVADLDQKLSKTISTLSDKEELLENRAQLIAELKEKQKALANNVKDTSQTLKQTERERKKLERDLLKLSANSSSNVRSMPKNTKSKVRPAPAVAKKADKLAADAPDTRDINDLVSHLRIRQTALSERLKKAKTDGDDQALRDEIAEIAALMVELTSRREGKSSAIRKILAGAELTVNDDNSVSLAERARIKLEAADAV